MTTWPEHDTAPCIDNGEHLRTQRHPLADCLVNDVTTPKPPIVFEEALAEFRRVWTKWDLLGDLGEKLTCTECDALADFLEALGEADAAEGLREAHAEGDDEGDSHYSGPFEADANERSDQPV